MSEQPSEVQAAVGEAIRSAIVVAMQAAELIATRRAEQARVAQAESETVRAEYAARLRAERDGAMPIMRQPWDDRWWRRALPEEIRQVWETTSAWAANGDPYARSTVEQMRRQIADRFDVQVPDQVPPGTDLAATLAGATDAGRRGAEATEFEAGEPQVDYRFTVHAAGDPSTVLAAGMLSADAAAGERDVAVQALRAYGRGSALMAGSAGERVSRLVQAATDSSAIHDLEGLAVTVQRADGAGAAPYTLEAGQLEQVRRALREEHEQLITSPTAAPSEVLAAIGLESRALRDELRERRLRARGAAGPQEQQTAREMTALQERLAELDLRRQAVQADARGEDGQLVVQAAILRGSLDRQWWDTASPAEIAGVWEHVAGWGDGAGKTSAQAFLRAGIHRTYGIGAGAGTADELAAAIESARAARGRDLLEDRDADRLGEQARQEDAAAVGSKDRAEGLDRAGEDPSEAGHGVDLAEAAGQDRAAAAALAEVADREAADAVAVAAQSWPESPSARLADRSGRRVRTAPRPRKRPRDKDLGRG